MNGPGGLEIYAAPQAEGADARPAGETAPPGAASLDTLRRKMAAPRSAHDTSVQQASRMEAWQKYLNELWAPR
jgi:hypothetical protein